MTAPSDTLFGEAASRKASAREPLSLSDPETVLLVRRGHVDLFATGLRSGGGNRHILRAAAGDVIFGIATGNLPEGVRIVAIAGPDTEIAELPLSRIRKSSATAAGDVVAIVEKWTSLLLESIARGNPPRKYSELDAGREVALAAEGDVALCRVVPLWVRLLAGRALYLGRADLPEFDPGAFRPLLDRMWVTAAGANTRLEPRETRALLDSGELWTSLVELHRFFIAALLADAANEGELDATLFAQRQEGDQATMSRALAELVAVVEGAEARVSLQLPSDDALLSACRRVARESGIELATREQIRKAGGAASDPLTTIAKVSRFRTRRIVLKGSWWTEENGPLLAFIDSTSPVALLPKRSGQYLLHNPADGSSTVVTEDVAAGLTGIAHVFYRPFPEGKLGALELLKFGLRGARRDMAVIVATGMGSGILGMLVPVITGLVFGSIIPTADRPQLVQMTIGLVIASMTVAIFQIAQSISLLRIEGRADLSLQSALWDRLLSLPAPFFRNYTAGELTVRSLMLDMIRQTLSTNTIAAVLGSIFSLFNFALLYYYDWKMALMCSGLVVVALALTSTLGYFQVKHQRPLFLLQSRISGTVFQFVSGIAKLRVAGAEPRAYAAWARLFAEQKEHSARARLLANRQAVFDSAFPVVCSMCIFGWMAFRGGEPLPTGVFLSFLAAFVGFLAGMLQINKSLVTAMNVVPMFEMAKSILDAQPEVDVSKSDPGELTGEIEVSHVSFRYGGDGPQILKDVSMRIRPGEFVAICGASGSGKSTLLRLLLGFEQPESGAVYYDGMDLSTLDMRAVRRQIGVVLQGSQLLPGDVFTNIVGSAPLTHEDAWAAATMAGFDDDLRQMPMGMYTMISEGGGNLSGGQKQRLMIARAIVHKPLTLYFDEATSALDNRTQSIVSNALDKLQATRVVIAHRLSTIRHANRIFVMDAGRIVQSGTYDELIAQDGIFADLAKRQML